MKKTAGFKMFVVAVAAASALCSTGCKSAWKFSNPFEKAPKAAASDAPSELDELDDITPPPESYTTGDASPKKDADDESLAQNGAYVAPQKNAAAQKPSAAPVADVPDTAFAVASAGITPNADSSATNAPLANAVATSNALAANENFQTPSYGQSYQVPTNDVAAPNYAATPNNSVAQTQTPAPQIAANTTPYPASSFAPVATETASVAQNSTPFPTIDANQNYATLNVAAQNPAPAQTTSNARPQYAQTSVPNEPVYVAQNPAPNAQPANAPFPTAVAPQTAPNGAAPANDAYSDVYYQQQTTSGGFAPGSVGVY